MNQPTSNASAPATELSETERRAGLLFCQATVLLIAALGVANLTNLISEKFFFHALGAYFIFALPFASVMAYRTRHVQPADSSDWLSDGY